MTGQTEKVRIAAIADVHCGKDASGSLQLLFAEVKTRADILLLCGDLTNHGLPEEVHVLIKELAAAQSMPILAVLGNHDYESGKQQEVKEILADARIRVLDGEGTEVLGVGCAGVKGFAGGFGRRMLEPWGETSIKQFVGEAIEEAVKLESALATLRTPTRIAMLHYSPIQATVEGEPPEIFAFLGSSRLEEPLNRHGVRAAFHGHAHHGHPEGKTSTGIPVYNVSMSLLSRTYAGKTPFRVLEIADPSGTDKGSLPTEELQGQNKLHATPVAERRYRSAAK